MQFTINDETYTADRIDECDDANVAMVTVEECSREYYLAENDEEAGKVAKARWADMAEHDKAEFRCMIGDEVLLSWAMGEANGPGNDKSPTNMQEWLDLVAKHPDEELASYDGEERDIDKADAELIEELGFAPIVAYRHN